MKVKLNASPLGDLMSLSLKLLFRNAIIWSSLVTIPLDNSDLAINLDEGHYKRIFQNSIDLLYLTHNFRRDGVSQITRNSSCSWIIIHAEQEYLSPPSLPASFKNETNLHDRTCLGNVDYLLLRSYWRR